MQEQDPSSKAQQAYDRRYQQAGRLIERLQVALQRHRSLCRQQGQNWGGAGDLAHVTEKLADLVGFFEGEEGSVILARLATEEKR